MEALWLKSQGLSHGEIAPLTSIFLTLDFFIDVALELNPIKPKIKATNLAKVSTINFPLNFYPTY